MAVPWQLINIPGSGKHETNLILRIFHDSIAAPFCLERALAIVAAAVLLANAVDSSFSRIVREACSRLPNQRFGFAPSPEKEGTQGCK